MDRICKIAFEEHFMMPGFERYSEGFLNNIEAAAKQSLLDKLGDFDALRLAAMDSAGIEIAILSQSGPGIQAEKNTTLAILRAQENNDFLAQQIARHPTRYAGFATLPMQDPVAAANELQRAVTQLGFKGSLINGHTNGMYYDHCSYDVFWERMQALDVPLYLHPTDSYLPLHALAQHAALAGATWGWGVETASHALRILFSGVFDRFPKLKIILGHMGEGLPFQRWRFDSRFAVYPFGAVLQKPPSAYIGSNIFITTSGVCSPHALVGAIGEIGAEAVFFSVDYPYESSAVAADFIEQARLDDATRKLICYENAQRIFKL